MRRIVMIGTSLYCRWGQSAMPTARIPLQLRRLITFRFFHQQPSSVVSNIEEYLPTIEPTHSVLILTRRSQTARFLRHKHHLEAYSIHQYGLRSWLSALGINSQTNKNESGRNAMDQIGIRVEKDKLAVLFPDATPQVIHEVKIAKENVIIPESLWSNLQKTFSNTADASSFPRNMISKQFKPATHHHISSHAATILKASIDAAAGGSTFESGNLSLFWARQKPDVHDAFLMDYTDMLYLPLIHGYFFRGVKPNEPTASTHGSAKKFDVVLYEQTRETPLIKAFTEALGDQVVEFCDNSLLDKANAYSFDSSEQEDSRISQNAIHAKPATTNNNRNHLLPPTPESFDVVSCLRLLSYIDTAFPPANPDEGISKSKDSYSTKHLLEQLDLLEKVLVGKDSADGDQTSIARLSSKQKAQVCQRLSGMREMVVYVNMMTTGDELGIYEKRDNGKLQKKRLTIREFRTILESWTN